MYLLVVQKPIDSRQGIGIVVVQTDFTLVVRIAFPYYCTSFGSDFGTLPRITTRTAFTTIAFTSSDIVNYYLLATQGLGNHSITVSSCY